MKTIIMFTTLDAIQMPQENFNALLADGFVAKQTKDRIKYLVIEEQ